MKPFVPNTVLPAGAKLLPRPEEMQLGAYQSLKYDAVLELDGVRWYRVQFGCSSLNDREDWVADVDEIGPCVCDYHWNNIGFGLKHYGSFEEASRARLAEASREAEDKIKRLTAQVNTLREAVNRIRGNK